MNLKSIIPGAVWAAMLAAGCSTENGAASASPAQPKRPEGSHYFVLSPNGGERFRLGLPLIVRITSDDRFTYAIEQAIVQVSFDDGKTFFSPAFTTADQGETWAWTITPEIADDFGNTASCVSQQCIVKVADYLNPDDFDISDNRFTVSP